MHTDKNIVNGSHEGAELSLPESEDIWLGPDELELLAKELATASNTAEAARIRGRLARGFYGV
jgi:hypothetical protein